MIYPCPPSSLLPYTTLFRSERRRAISSSILVSQGSPFWSARGFLSFCRSRTEQASSIESFFISVLNPDRKSTRLNSSHVSISYAVFCLKKKKKHDDFFYKIS